MVSWEHIHKSKKEGKIRHQYNQVPHFTKDTNGKVTRSQFGSTNESQTSVIAAIFR